MNDNFSWNSRFSGLHSGDERQLFMKFSF